MSAAPGLAALQDYVFPRPVPITIVRAHAHLSAAHLEDLFGPRHELNPRHELPDRRRFLCTELLTLAVGGQVLQGLPIVGPPARSTRVQLPPSTARRLGANFPLGFRADESRAGTPGMLLGPAGKVELEQGLYIPDRNLRLSPHEARAFGLSCGDRVRVVVPGPRGVFFNEVLVRVHERHKLALHIDEDEANAVLAKKGDLVYVVDETKLGLDLQVKLARPSGGRRLMTEAELQRILRTQGRVRIPAGVILTPSARDLARRLKLS